MSLSSSWPSAWASPSASGPHAAADALGGTQFLVLVVLPDGFRAMRGPRSGFFCARMFRPLGLFRRRAAGRQSVKMVRFSVKAIAAVRRRIPIFATGKGRQPGPGRASRIARLRQGGVEAWPKQKTETMKKAMTFIAASLMLAASCTARQGAPKAAETADGGAQPSGKKVLVAYFSCTGTTEAAAEAVARATGGRLYRIRPKQEYTAADLDWNDKSSRSSVEMRDDKARPELADRSAAVDSCDVVFVGYPIWWNLCPRVVNTFLEAYDFSGKTIVPFATSGGSSISNSEAELRRLYGAKGTWKPGRLLNSGASGAAEWAREVMAE